jgi:hydroxypyruvate isomerase
MEGVRMTAVKQSVSWWCFASSELRPEQLVRTAAEIGYAAFDLVGPEHWPLIKAYGLEIAAIKGHTSIEMGVNRLILRP